MPPYSPPPQTGARPFAGWWSRVAAQILDWIIVSIIPIVLFFIVFSNNDVGPYLLSGLILLVGAVYYALTIGRSGENNGQTIGMQVVGIRIVRETGEPMTAGTAILRETLIKGILMAICFIVTILNYLAPLWDDRNQAWHDKIGNTLVVEA